MGLSLNTSSTERILARMRSMCPGYARVYLAWVQTPAEDRAGRMARLSAVRNHLIVCGCAHEGKVNNEWIFVDEQES